MGGTENIKELFSKLKTEINKSMSTKERQQTGRDDIFARAGLNFVQDRDEDGDGFSTFDAEKLFDTEMLDFSVKKGKENSDKSNKLVFDGKNSDKITDYIQSKIDASTLPDNANLNNSRLIVGERGEVKALSFKLTDKYGNTIGNVEYDIEGNIRHIGQIQTLEDGKFKIDEKYYDEEGNEITFDKEAKGKDKNTYNIDDFKKALDLINSSGGKYDIVLDANADGVIDINDLKKIGFNLPFDLKITDIKKKSLETFEPEGDVDHEIGVSKQGKIGDCWLLATLNSLSYTEKGQQIIDDAITTNDDGTYTINFQGVDTSITISDEELQQIKAMGVYSSGDDDVLLMEIATEKIMDLIKEGKVDAPDFLRKAAEDGTTSISGGWLRDMMYLLTGASSDFAQNESEINNIFNEMQNNPEDYAAFMTFNPNESGNNPVVKDVNGNEVELVTGHAWSIKSVDGDTVTIVNPWDSGNSYTISKSELMKNIGVVNFSNLNQYQGKKECSNNIRYNADGSDIEKMKKRDKDGNTMTVTKDKDKENYTRQVVTFEKHGNISDTIETVYDEDGKVKSISVTENEYDNDGNLIRTTKKQYNGSGHMVSSDNNQISADDKKEEE